MGLFDMFARKGPGALRKHAARAGNKRAQNPDRWESIQALAALGTAEATEALLKRFTFRIDPSITDQEEKEVAFQGVIAAGSHAVEPVRAFMRSSDSISWPLKMLESLVSPDEVVEELLWLLSTMDTEYERDPEKKIQVVAYLEDRRDAQIVEAVQPFLEDMNETVRFHAVGSILAQENAEAAREKLLPALLAEESVRVRARILDGFIDRAWGFEEPVREGVRKMLPAGYALDGEGRAHKG